jgi:sarcosine oxidase gamma subunit
MSASSLIIRNAVSRLRVGCKGPAAEAWLHHQAIAVPSGPNRYSVDARGLLCARLATSEFLFEATANSAVDPLARARRALEYADIPSGVYPVLRQDHVIEITGDRAQDLFLQTCAVDLLPVERESREVEGPIVLTSMIGVSVVLACRPSASGSTFTIWLDPSYAHYFWHEIHTIAAELGGTAAPASPVRPGGFLS